MAEQPARHQLVLLGSSQTRTEVDTKVLNARLAGRLWSTELHFPGSTPYDLIFTTRRLPETKIDYVVVYVSETMFYGSKDNSRLMYFFGAADFPLYLTISGQKPRRDSFLVAGMMGALFPVYRIWEPLATRLRGAEWDNRAQAKHDSSLETNLGERARRVALTLTAGAHSDFQKQCFEQFAGLCRERGARLIVCCGQSNPILERRLDPSIRPDMMNFLHRLASKDPNIVLLEPPDLPRHTESEYDDLNHINSEARARFSAYIADKLDQLIVTQPR